MPRKKKIDYSTLFTKRKDGRYVASYTDETGRHYIYDKDPEALYNRLEKVKERPALTFKEIAEFWKGTWDTLRDGTLSSYSSAYDRAVDRFGDKLPTDILPMDISAHLVEMKNADYAASTISTQKTVYSRIFQNAIESKTYGRVITMNPASSVKLPKGTKKAKTREAPEDDVVKTIVANADTAYFGFFPLFLICTGFRRSEALAIQWKDIDFKAKEISCTKQINARNGTAKLAELKTESGVRTVPLIPQIETRLKRMKLESGCKPSDYLFYGEDPALPMPSSTYNRRWMHYCKDMGFVTDTPEKRISKQKKHYIVHHYKPTLTAHVFRHGYATMLFEAGVDVYTMQKLLGHAEVETTLAIYTHLRNRLKKSATETFIKYMDSAL